MFDRKYLDGHLIVQSTCIANLSHVLQEPGYKTCIHKPPNSCLAVSKSASFCSCSSRSFSAACSSAVCGLFCSSSRAFSASSFSRRFTFFSLIRSSFVNLARRYKESKSVITSPVMSVNELLVAHSLMVLASLPPLALLSVSVEVKHRLNSVWTPDPPSLSG